MPSRADESRQLTGLRGTDHRELDSLVVGPQKAGDRELRRDRIDAHLRMTPPPSLYATFEFTVGTFGKFLGSASQDEHGALRRFASQAAYLTTSSLSGASVIRTTIQLISGGGRSDSVRSIATGQCAPSATSAAVDPSSERA